MPIKYRPVAQLAEWRSPKPQVGGSIPSWPANYQVNMKSSNEDQSKMKDILSWLAVVLVTAGAFFCTYYYTFSGPIQSIVWLSWFVIALFLFYMTTSGKQVFAFAQEAKMELLKVVWPTRQETVQTTTIVMVMVTLTGFILWGVDSLMMWAIAKITHLG
ncbi:preprotein translocase subunit SecE [Legionella shakespearei DSM 23087]|uniref:Protein translocase subunit SecE n=2 Tax=Legionella shakespearei TaxID=45075 RepID=A0A0W0YVW9_9GAMM|nr:preprotein translocase subunit SecE [Legionella shakespearei DSM 23087]